MGRWAGFRGSLANPDGHGCTEVGAGTSRLGWRKMWWGQGSRVKWMLSVVASQWHRRRGPSSLAWPCSTLALPRTARTGGKSAWSGNSLMLCPTRPVTPSQGSEHPWGGNGQPHRAPSPTVQRAAPGTALLAAEMIHGERRLQGCTSLKRKK